MRSRSWEVPRAPCDDPASFGGGCSVRKPASVQAEVVKKRFLSILPHSAEMVSSMQLKNRMRYELFCAS